MPIAKSTEELLEEIYADSRVSAHELVSLRNVADEKSAAILAELGRHNDFAAFQKSCDVTVQLLQNVAIDVKQEDLSELGEARVLDALQAQLAYLKAAVQMVEQALFTVGPVGDLPD